MFDQLVNELRDDGPVDQSLTSLGHLSKAMLGAAVDVFDGGGHMQGMLATLTAIVILTEVAMASDGTFPRKPSIVRQQLSVLETALPKGALGLSPRHG